MPQPAALAVLVATAWCSRLANAQDAEATTTTPFDAVAKAEESVSAPVMAQKLRDDHAKMRGLEAMIRQTQRMLAASEGVFATTVHDIALRQEDLRNLSHTTGGNAAVLAKLNALVSTDSVKMQAAGQMITLMSQQADENEKKAKAVERMAKQMNSMGDIKNKGGGCLDAVEREREGSNLQMWECLKGRESQEWALNPQTKSLKSLHGICLAAPDPNAAGGNLMMWGCDPSSASQQWTYDEEAFTLKTSGGLCLNAASPSVKGSALALAACDASQNQKWDMVVGSTGLRQQLNELSDQMWDMQNPASPTSISTQEDEIKEVETGVGGFMHQLSQKARVVLTNRLRHRANNLRSAIHRLGDAAGGGSSSEGMLLAPEKSDDDVAPQAFGADLGLAAAAAAA